MTGAAGIILAFALSLLAPAFAQDTVSIGSKKFTESYVLAEMAKIRLEEAGYSVRHREGLGGTLILWQALRTGAISAYPEYTATLSEEILKDPGQSAGGLRSVLEKLGLGMTGDLGFEDSYTLVMTRQRAAALGISTIGDLKRYPGLKAGPTPEFFGRQDGWQPLLAFYGLTFETVQTVEHGLGYRALRSGQIDLKDCYTTDAKIAEYDLLALTDSKHFFPSYRAVFLYRLDLPRNAVDALRGFEGKISADRMRELNRLAEDKKDYAAAASAFFEAKPDSSLAQRRTRERGLSAIPRLTLEHLSLVTISLAGAILAGIPLGIAASAKGLAGEVILGGAGIVQTIPSLALLALMIPVFGIGQPPAIAALFLYSLLPIVSGTAAGLRSLPAPLKQAGAALGLTPFQRLRLIELPLASPFILAGIKTSAVINTGTATLAGLIGGGGFGEPIQSGLQLNDTGEILTGAVPAVILALLVQAAFAGLEAIAIPKGLRLRRAARNIKGVEGMIGD